MRAATRDGSEGGLGKLPVELQAQIVEAVKEFPIGMDEAKKFRGRLVGDRGLYRRMQNDLFNGAMYPLCKR